jgi:hypothetical protein
MPKSPDTADEIEVLGAAKGNLEERLIRLKRIYNF